jgi:leader peptidase (prepilin peptidase)/N-methyltransferase
MPLLITATALLGLVIGSFLNVVAYRVPQRVSLSVPASHCPACDHPVRARHNVPVLGWLVLGGRCADCRAPISPRYPLVESGTAALFVALALKLAAVHQLPALPGFLYLGAIGVALSLIDIDTQRLPDRIVLPSYPVLLVLLAGAAIYQQDWYALARTGIGCAALFGVYLLIALAHPSGMGFGDVKLAGLLGAGLGYLSWASLVVGAFAAFLLGGVVAIATIALRRGDRKTALPFGPFMIAGMLLGIFLGGSIAHAYLDLFVS